MDKRRTSVEKNIPQPPISCLSAGLAIDSWPTEVSKYFPWENKNKDREVTDKSFFEARVDHIDIFPFYNIVRVDPGNTN